MSIPTISVVIPAYNNESTLGATLDSLLAQTVPVLEIIVVDDCSDNEVSVFLGDRYPTINVIRHDINRGVQSARNTGFDQVSGQYVLFLDADDLLFPEFLSVTSQLLEKETAYAACFGNFHRCNDGNSQPFIEKHTEQEPDTKRYDPEEGLSYYLGNTGAFIPSFTLFRKSMLDDVCVENNLFPPEVWGNEDFHLFVRVIAKHDVLQVRNPLGVYFLRPDSLSRNQVDVWSSRIVAVESLINLAKAFPFLNKGIDKLEILRSSAARRHARLLYTQGVRGEALKNLFQEFKRSPSVKTFGLLCIVGLRLRIKKRFFAGTEY